jgi:serine/threonine protein kinase
VKRATSSPPRLGGFEFIRVLGSGGFSDVFLYEQQLPRREVAVKVLLTDGLTAAGRAAFVAEANVMARLSRHPYIVTILQAGVSDDDRPYFIMDYYGGPSLDSYKVEVLPVAEALRAGVRIASAVATAHDANILHRDIKPANILTDEYGRPGLTDFGISSTMDNELPIHTTTRAALGGTGTATGHSGGMSVPWSPPESFDEDQTPDVRSDVFSLAATIHTMLVGRTPFEVPGGPNGQTDLWSRIERGAITPITRTGVPPSLVAVLRKAMSVDRERRHPTAVDFARALQGVELELRYPATTIEVPNHLLHSAPKAPVGDAADETRMRGVTSIEAQPAVTVPALIPEQTAPQLDVAATQLRGAPRVEAQPALHKTVAKMPKVTADGPSDRGAGSARDDRGGRGGGGVGLETHRWSALRGNAGAGG